MKVVCLHLAQTAETVKEVSSGFCSIAARYRSAPQYSHSAPTAHKRSCCSIWISSIVKGVTGIKIDYAVRKEQRQRDCLGLPAW